MSTIESRRLRRALLWIPVMSCVLSMTASALPDEVPPVEEVSPAEHAPSETPQELQPRTPRQNEQARNTIVLLAIVTGIALTGLLLMIVAVAARGLSRKMAVREVDEPLQPRKEPGTPEQPSDDVPLPSPAPQHDALPPDAR
jgi:hypothetical protein